MFLFSDPATPETYTLSLHDALPIFGGPGKLRQDVRDQLGKALAPATDYTSNSILVNSPKIVIVGGGIVGLAAAYRLGERLPDRKSTRLNSSHTVISYAVFCLKKKKQ